MAGSEQEGVDGADPRIFDGAVWVLTPTEGTDDLGLRDLQTIVSSMGCDVVTMAPERHDALVAIVPRPALDRRQPDASPTTVR